MNDKGQMTTAVWFDKWVKDAENRRLRQRQVAEWLDFIGSVLVLVEENKNDCEIRHWKAEVVDGERIKADTWYQLDENGEFQEVKE